MSENSEHLKSCRLLQEVPAKDLSQLEGRCRVRRFARSTPIYLPADAADGVLLLASGRAKICSFTREGKQVIFSFVEPGELFGELSIVAPEAREDYAEALETSLIVTIPTGAMHELMQRFPNVALGMSHLIGLRRRRLERRLKYLLFRSSRERLIQLLVELAEQYGAPCADGLQLSIKLSHQDLANIIGSTRETVTVLLGDLQTEGHLITGRRRIVITDLSKLIATGDLSS